MKYLKHFETEAQYEVFKGENEYILPNVSYIKQNNDVKYNPYQKQEVELISFIVSDPFYTVFGTAEKGMTFREWYNSNYFTESMSTFEDIYIDGNNIIFVSASSTLIYSQLENMADEVIEEDGFYSPSSI